MDLGTIIVLILAVLFFGGLTLLVWSEQKKSKSQATKVASMEQPINSQLEQTARRKRRAG